MPARPSTEAIFRAGATMDPARRQRISELNPATLPFSTDERDRDAFLRRACDGDAALRADVESRIHQKTGAGNTAEVPTGETLAAGVTASRIETSAVQYPARTTFHFHPFQAIVLLFSLVVLAAAIVAADAIWRYGHLRQELGWTGDSSVAAVTLGGPADGKLQPGDRVLAIDGDTRVATLGVYWKQTRADVRAPVLCGRSNETVSDRLSRCSFVSLKHVSASRCSFGYSSDVRGPPSACSSVSCAQQSRACQ